MNPPGDLIRTRVFAYWSSQWSVSNGYLLPFPSVFIFLIYKYCNYHLLGKCYIFLGLLGGKLVEQGHWPKEPTDCFKYTFFFLLHNSDILRNLEWNLKYFSFLTSFSWLLTLAKYNTWKDFSVKPQRRHYFNRLVNVLFTKCKMCCQLK